MSSVRIGQARSAAAPAQVVPGAARDEASGGKDGFAAALDAAGGAPAQTDGNGLAPRDQRAAGATARATPGAAGARGAGTGRTPAPSPPSEPAADPGETAAEELVPAATAEGDLAGANDPPAVSADPSTPDTQQSPFPALAAAPGAFLPLPVADDAPPRAPRVGAAPGGDAAAMPAAALALVAALPPLPVAAGPAPTPTAPAPSDGATNLAAVASAPMAVIPSASRDLRLLRDALHAPSATPADAGAVSAPGATVTPSASPDVPAADIVALGADNPTGAGAAAPPVPATGGTASPAATPGSGSAPPSPTFASLLPVSLAGTAPPPEALAAETPAAARPDRFRQGDDTAIDPAAAAPAALGFDGNLRVAPDVTTGVPNTAGLPPAGPQFAETFSNHVIRLAANSGGEAIVRLHPPALGELTVRVAVNGRDVSAWFGSAQPLVQQAISGALEQLQTSLGNAGYTLSGAWVGTDASGARDQGGGNAPRRPAPGFAAGLLPTTATAPAGQTTSRINIYV